MPANMICQICEAQESAHVCFTCVNPRQEINVCGGVLICASCKLTHHNSGIFLLHQTTSLEARYKRRLLQGRIKGFQLSVSENINNEVVSLNVRNAVNKSKVEATKTYVHKQLMEVYNAITSQLNAKEKELNMHVESNFRTLQEESEVCRDKLKELNSTVTAKSETLLAKLADENEEVDIEKIEAELEELESNVRSGLTTNMENKLGPYVKVDRGSFEVDHTVNIGTFRISQIDYYGIDEILQSSELFKETNTIEEGSNYVISTSFLTRAMLSQRQSVLYLPHPMLAKRGLWLRDAVEYYIQRKFEQNLYARLGDDELPDYSNKSIVLVKSRAQDYPTIMRCRFVLSDNDEKSKGKKSLRSDKAMGEVSIYPVDYYDLPVKTLSLSKVHFFKLDSYLEKVPLLLVKGGFHEVENSKGTTVFPDMSPIGRKKIQKVLETGKELSVQFRKLVATSNADVFVMWSVNAFVDGSSLAQLLVEGEETEMEKPKSQLCKDIRLQSGTSVPVIREIVGESAAKPVEEVAKQTAKEPTPPTAFVAELTNASLQKNEPEKSNISVEKSPEVIADVCISKESAESAAEYDCLEVNDHYSIDGNDPTNVLKAESTTSSFVEETLPVDSMECLKLLVLKPDQPPEPQLAPNFLRSDSSSALSSKSAKSDGILLDSKKMLQEHGSVGMPSLATVRSDGPRSGSRSREPAPPSTPQDLAFAESWLKDTEPQPTVTQQQNAFNNVTQSLSMKIQRLNQQAASFPTTRELSNQSPVVSHPPDYSQATPSGPHPPDYSQATPSGPHPPDYSQTTPPGPQSHMMPMQQRLPNSMAMVQPPNALDDPSKRSLSYLALVVYGEQSQEFQNSVCMDEPSPQIKRALYDQIQSQQSVWRLVPRDLLLRLMDVEMKRFPHLIEEFRRFGVPMNIYKLPFALGPQLYGYVERYPELKTIMKTINYEPVNQSPASSQPQQVFNSRLPAMESGTAMPVDDRGDAFPADTDRNMANMPEKNYKSQMSRGSQDHATNLPYSHSKHASQTTSENGDIDLKPSANDSGFEYRGGGGSSSQSSNYRDSEDWGASPDNGWIEDEDNGMAPPGGRGDPYRSNRTDKTSGVCFNCKETGHMRSECPKRSHRNSQRDPGRDSGRNYNHHSRRNDGPRSRTGGRGEGYNDSSWNSAR